MRVCKACWDVFYDTVDESAILQECPKPKCFGNELEDIDETLVPIIMILHKKGYFVERSSACHFYDFGTALTPTCFIQFSEEFVLGDLPQPPKDFTYETIGDKMLTMRKHYNAENQLDLHENILSTAIDLLRWARAIATRRG